MPIRKSSFCILAILAATAYAQTKPPLVDLEMMTWPELKAAIDGGKTTALIYNGGTETRGPQNVNGGHTLMAHATVVAIAEKLGNAIAAPVLPFSPNNASAALPGTIGLSTQVFASINEEVAEQLIKNGFKIVVLMGDHGGGQAQLGEVAKKLDDKYKEKGIHIYFSDMYAKSTKDFDDYLTAHNLPVSSHAGIPDTSEMMYLGTDKGWTRPAEIPNAVGAKPGQPSNGIRGDARPSTVALGKLAFDMKVDIAVKQIREFQSAAAAPAAAAKE